MGDIAGDWVVLGNSFLASATGHCDGSEDGLAGHPGSPCRGIGPVRGGLDNDARKGSGAGSCVAILSLSEFLREELGGENIEDSTLG